MIDTSTGEARSFGDLEKRQRSLAVLLRDGGMREGDRIALLSANRVEVVELCVVALRSGIVPVPINPLLTESEYAHILNDCGTRWLFTDRPVSSDVPRVTQLDELAAIPTTDRDAASDLAPVTRGRAMHYTSGTTGVPKGVWVTPPEPQAALRISKRFTSLWGMHEGDVHLVCSPLAHSAPLRFSIRTLEAGGTVVVQPRFEAGATLAALAEFGVTTTFMVPTHIERILTLPTLDHARVDTMRLLAHAGAPIRRETKLAALDVFPGDSVWEFYGSTEGQATRISAREWRRKPGSVGRALPGVEIIITDESGARLGERENGEVWVLDPEAERFVYWNDADKTDEAWRAGAFTVGDLGHVDEDGYLFLVGRKYDTIITGGVNVYPQEVEAIIDSHPAVEESMVYGTADDEWGQQVRACVVVRPGYSVDVDVLTTWLRARLASFKCPRTIHFVSELQRTSTGKMLRRPPEGEI